MTISTTTRRVARRGLPLAAMAAVAFAVGAAATSPATGATGDGDMTLNATMRDDYLRAMATHPSRVEANVPDGITLVRHVTGAECETYDVGDREDFDVVCDSSAAGKTVVITLTAFRDGDYGTTVAEQRIVRPVGEAGPVALSTSLATVPGKYTSTGSVPAGQTTPVVVTSEPGAKVYAHIGDPGDAPCAIVNNAGRPLGYGQFHVDVPANGRITVPVRCPLEAAGRDTAFELSAAKGTKPAGAFEATLRVTP